MWRGALMHQTVRRPLAEVPAVKSAYHRESGLSRRNCPVVHLHCFLLFCLNGGKFKIRIQNPRARMARFCSVHVIPCDCYRFIFISWPLLESVMFFVNFSDLSSTIKVVSWEVCFTRDPKTFPCRNNSILLEIRIPSGCCSYSNIKWFLELLANQSNPYSSSQGNCHRFW